MKTHFLRPLPKKPGPFGAFVRRNMWLLMLVVSVAVSSAVIPTWWASRQVLNEAAVDDYAAANVGQLKTLTYKAAQEMDAVLPDGGAGEAIHSLIASWRNPSAAGVARDDYAAINAGQAKTVAKMFYDRLSALGLRPLLTYPWTSSTASKDDYAMVNVGQLKTLFAFPIHMAPSSFHLVGTTDSTVSLAWSDDVGASYRVERSPSGDAGTFATVMTGEGPDAPDAESPFWTWKDIGLAQNTSYFYRVIAIFSDADSVPSYAIRAVTRYSAPATPPTITGVSSITDTSATVAWTATDVSHLTGFLIESKVEGTEVWQPRGSAGAGASSLGVVGLEQATAYRFRVLASNPAGTSASTPSAPFTTQATVPSVPLSAVIAAQSATGATLGWSHGAGPRTGYEIQRRQDGTGSWQTVTSSVAAAATSWSDTGLTATAGYEYQIRALNAGQVSSWVGSGLAVPPVPGVPSTFDTSNASWNQMTLSWSGVTQGADGVIELRRYLGGSATGTATLIELPASTTSYTDSGLTAATAYTYTIKVRNRRGSSLTATEIHRTTPSSLPLAASNLAAVEIEARRVKLTWTDNATDEVSYTLQRKLQAESIFTTLAMLSPDSVAYEDQTVKGATSYTYRLFSTNQYGDSSAVTLAVTTPDYPNANTIPDGAGLLSTSSFYSRLMDVFSTANPAYYSFTPSSSSTAVDLTPMSTERAIFGGQTPYDGRRDVVKIWSDYYSNWLVIDVATLVQDGSVADEGLRVARVGTTTENDVGTVAVFYHGRPSDVLVAEGGLAAQSVEANQLVLSGDLVFWGMPSAGKAFTVGGDPIYCGAVHVYRVSPNNSSAPLAYVGSIWPPTPSAGDFFGRSIACDAGRLLVGSPGADYTKGGVGYTNGGCAYVYEITSSTTVPTTPVATITPPNPANNQKFAHSVSLAGRKFVAGAPGETYVLPVEEELAPGVILSYDLIYANAGAIYLGSMGEPNLVKVTNPLLDWGIGVGFDALTALAWSDGLGGSQFGAAVSIDHSMRVLAGVPTTSGAGWQSAFAEASGDSPAVDAMKTLAWNLGGMLSQGSVWQYEWNGRSDEEFLATFGLAGSFGRSAGLGQAPNVPDITAERGDWLFSNQLNYGYGVEWQDDTGIFSVSSVPESVPVYWQVISDYSFVAAVAPATWQASNGVIEAVDPVTGGILYGVDSDGDPVTLGLDHDSNATTPPRLEPGTSTGVDYVDYGTGGAVPLSANVISGVQPFLTNARPGPLPPGLSVLSGTADGLYAASLRVADDRGGLRPVPLMLRVGTGAGAQVTDSDDDGIPDDWETSHSMNPNNAQDASSDTDMDGLTAYQEYVRSKNNGTRGVNPSSWDLDPNGDEDHDGTLNKEDADPFDPLVHKMTISLDAAVLPVVALP